MASLQAKKHWNNYQKQYKNIKYNTDPDYAERMRARALEYSKKAYATKKEFLRLSRILLN